MAHLAVLTVDRGDDAVHRLACRQGAGHPQRVIDGLFGFEQRSGAFELPHGCCWLAFLPPADSKGPVDVAGVFLERQQDLAGRS